MSKPIRDNAPLPNGTLACSSQRVACVLSAREHGLFFPNGIDVAGCELEVIDAKAKEWASALSAFNPAVVISGWSTPQMPAAWLQGQGCALRYVCHITGSVRRLALRDFIRRGGLVTNWGSTCAPLVAEHALLLALSALRNLPAWQDYMQVPPTRRHWTQLQTHTIYGKRIGIHGFGQIARALIGLLRPFGVSICVYSECVPEHIVREHGVLQAASLHALFADSDVLFECEALTERTESSVTAALLAALGDGAVFVNVGRGRVVDEAALLAEAASGRLRVAVDVCANEPIDSESALLRVRNLIASPHIGGPTVDQLQAVGGHALGNLRRYLNAQQPDSVVTLAVYDRST